MDGTEKISLICSNKPHASVQKGAKGHAGWARDPFHAEGEPGKTLCGIPADGWLVMLERHLDDALQDAHLCKRCASKLEQKRH